MVLEPVARRWIDPLRLRRLPRGYPDHDETIMSARRSIRDPKEYV